ncbi:phosphatase PAP2 family protein [Cognatilysobacter terrigena]|uniref:phosphatase PAP2 family protein n=1 Tax=Cognatilysobacter terrigena TaxID=2488749 RepID=UPI0010610E68|nr:phosphatase PAP2 family protein [Lysobacter terrigena]
MPAFDHPPAYLTFGRRAGVVALAVAVNSAIYLAINHRQPSGATVIEPSALDMALGRHAWTIWPYWLLLLLAPAFALAISERRVFVATMRAYVVALMLNVALWLSVPTRLPRVPLPDGLDAATSSAWRLLLALDAPGNCFPSGHVTLPIVIATGFTTQYPRYARAAWLSIAVLLPSVVTTGQHVVADVIGGLATALFGLALTRHPFLRRSARQVHDERAAMETETG